MTKSTITDERITSVIERLEHFASNLKWTDVRGAQDLLTAADGLRELQERRKAAMDSDPVAWMSKGGTVLNGMRQSAYDFAHYNIPLYRHAQPAPVVPEEMYWQDAPVEGSTRAAAYARGWNACRAAMLAAAQPAPTIQVTDAMAYAFHHALTDGPLGDDDVEDIKTGLRSAFANVSTNQSVLVVPDRFIFEKWWETQNGSPLDGWDSLRTTDGYCDEVIDGQFEAWRACRAAMCATDKSSNHADCQSKLIKNCASGASAKQHG